MLVTRPIAVHQCNTGQIGLESSRRLRSIRTFDITGMQEYAAHCYAAGNS